MRNFEASGACPFVDTMHGSKDLMTESLDQRIAQLSADIARLTLLTTRSEARLKDLERRRRWLSVLILGGGLLAFLVGHFSAGPQSAQADSGLGAAAGQVEQALERRAQAAITELSGFEEKERQRFSEIIAGVRQDLNRAKDGAFEPGIAVAVILHDMKQMLEAVPRMADDMHRMTNDMHEMNQKMSAVPAMAAEMNLMNRQMGVMSQGVDSTMGRMGRMMPWMP